MVVKVEYIQLKWDVAYKSSELVKSESENATAEEVANDYCKRNNLILRSFEEVK